MTVARPESFVLDPVRMAVERDAGAATEAVYGPALMLRADQTHDCEPTGEGT